MIRAQSYRRVEDQCGALSPAYMVWPIPNDAHIAHIRSLLVILIHSICVKEHSQRGLYPIGMRSTNFASTVPSDAMVFLDLFLSYTGEVIYLNIYLLYLFLCQWVFWFFRLCEILPFLFLFLFLLFVGLICICCLSEFVGLTLCTVEETSLPWWKNCWDRCRNF